MAILSSVPPGLAFLSAWGGMGSGSPALFFTPVFVFYGLQTSADIIGSYNYVMELAPSMGGRFTSGSPMAWPGWCSCSPLPPVPWWTPWASSRFFYLRFHVL